MEACLICISRWKYVKWKWQRNIMTDYMYSQASGMQWDQLSTCPYKIKAPVHVDMSFFFSSEYMNQISWLMSVNNGKRRPSVESGAGLLILSQKM